MSGAGRRVAAGLILVIAAWPSLALGAGTTVSTHVCPQSFASTTLGTAEPTPTPNTSAALTGTAEQSSTVNITVNGVTRATLTADPGGSFAATVPLTIGDNTIVAIADDGAFCGHSSTSPPVLLHRDQVPPPAPSISAPVSGLVTTATSVLVQGSAEAGSTLALTVGGVPAASVTVGGDGLFAVSVPLSLGANVISATATNPAGASPESAPVTVTRQPVTVQQPTPPVVSPPPTPSPPSPLPPNIPQIISPTTGTTTTAESIIVQIQGSAGKTAYISLNGSVVASVRLASDGTATVSIPLTDGDNAITVTVGGQHSAATIVHRQAPTLSPPVITSPNDGFVTKDASIVVTGQAPPGARVTIIVGRAEAATVESDETGHFAARVNLRTGFNLIYVELDAPGGAHLRSASIQVDRETSTATVTKSLRKTLTDLATLPVAAILLTAQALETALSDVAASPSATVLVLVSAGFVSTASRGLLGLELLLLLPGLLWSRRRYKHLIHGQVVDTVTNRPLALAKVTSSSDRKSFAITGRSGSFAIAHSAPGEALILQASRPGYQQASIQHPDTTITLEPSTAGLSPREVFIDIIIGIISWTSMGFAAALSLYLAAHQPGTVSFGAAVIFLGILVVNIIILIHQPHYRWGRITDQSGNPIPNVSTTLTNAKTGEVVSTFQTDPSGRYTLHAPMPGDFHLTASFGGQQVYSEPVTIRRRPAYLGWRISTPRIP